MQTVALDPVVSRPLRAEPAPGRAPGDGSPGGFDAMLDAKSNEAPRQPRAERAPRADGRPARDAEPRDAQGTSIKPADAPTRQAKNGESSDCAEPAVEKPAANAPVVRALTTEDFAAVAAIAEIAPKNAGAIPAATDEAAPVPEATDRKPEAGDDTGAVSAEFAVAPLAETPIAIAVAAPAPINPAPVVEQTTDTTAIAPVQAAPAPPAPADIASEETQPTAVPSVAGETAPKPVAAAPRIDGDIKGAPEDKPKTQPNDAGTAETHRPRRPRRHRRSSARPRAPTSPDLIRSRPLSPRASPMRRRRRARPRLSAAARPRELSAEPQAKTATPEPRGPSAEPAAAPRALPAEARTEAAPQAALPLTGAVNNAPVMPFHLALSSSLALPALPHAALRIDAAADNAVAIGGLAVEIVSRAQDGLKRFDIRLDPPELGRIDVRLDVDHGGKVTSRLVVERAETLDLLRRDAPQLERALQHAGLNTEGGLQFSLRDQNFASRDQLARDSTNTSHLIVPEDDTAAAEAARRGYGRLVGLGGGVDIRV